MPAPKTAPPPTPDSAKVAPSPAPPRTRSPNYPAIDLKAAVEKARALYGSARRHAVGVETVATAWGYSLKSSGFKLSLAAVQYFGLLIEEPNGDHKLLKLSPLALDIVADFAEGSEGYNSAIKRAAILPKLHAELWKMWGSDLPPDVEIRRYLVRQRGFNDNTVGEFIAEYKATLSFAKPDGERKIAEEEEGDGDGSDANGGDDPPPEKNKIKRRPMTTGTVEAVLPGKGSNAVVIQWPEKMTAEEVQDFEDWLPIILRKVKRAAESIADDE